MRYVSFKFDDGFLEGCQKAADILAPDPASFFLIGDLVSGRSALEEVPLFRDRRFGPPEAWQALVARGCELQPHSATHANFSELTPAQQLQEVCRSVADVRAISGRASVFGFPYNVLTPVDMAGTGLVAAGFETVGSDQPPLYHDLNTQVDLWQLKSWALREAHLEDILVTLAGLPDNAWIVLTFHSLDGEGHEPWSSDAFRRLVEGVRALAFTTRAVGSMAEMIQEQRRSETVQAAAEKLTPVGEEALYIAEVEAMGRRFRFLQNSRQDHIQGFFAQGQFYEREELEMICRLASGARRFLDVGANIGTHTIYLAHHLNLEHAVPVEPQPAVLDLVRANMGLNWHPSFDLSHLGIGLGASKGQARIGTFTPSNLGGTRLSVEGHDDPSQEMNPEMAAPGMSREYTIPIEAGDTLFAPGAFDLIKIDAEGMEIDVLEGMQRMLADFDGLMFIEVRDDKAAEFAAYVEARGWRRTGEYRRYQRCTNWFLEKNR